LYFFPVTGKNEACVVNNVHVKFSMFFPSNAAGFFADEETV
jgi:hypothetical protein